MSEPIETVEAAVAALGALPVPVVADRAKAPWGRGEDGRPLLPMGAHWTDIPELVDRTVAGIQARVDEATSGHWYVSPVPGDRPGTVSTHVGGVPLTVGQCTNMLSADLELVLHAHDDLSWCLEMIAKFRARVAELEAAPERLSYRERAARERLPAKRLAWRMLARAEESERTGEVLLTAEADEVPVKCRCDEPGADPYSCEADDCTSEFSELGPFGGSVRPVHGQDAKVSRTCGCGWRTSVWHVDDGSAEEELHGHVVRVHGGVYPEAGEPR